MRGNEGSSEDHAGKKLNRPQCESPHVLRKRSVWLECTESVTKWG